MPLFEVAILEMPEKKKDEPKGLERLIHGPVAVVAADQQGAIINLVLEQATKLKDVNRERMRIFVRPFA